MIAEGLGCVYDIEIYSMATGEFLTRVLIWIALGGYFLGEAALLYSRLGDGSKSAFRVARAAWTIGCVGLLIHVSFAFHYFHAWSHQHAQVETARQTAEVVGVAWGGGLYINYMLMLAWTADALWWWISPRSWVRRSRTLGALWRGTLFFIVFNAMVVFKTGPLRWVGLGLTLALGLGWLSFILQRTRTAYGNATPAGTKG